MADEKTATKTFVPAGKETEGDVLKTKAGCQVPVGHVGTTQCIAAVK